MIQPKISIVTPSFNQGAYLERTIRSVLEQDYPNLQYVVMDGGSTDESVEIIQRHADRLDFWASEPDGGHADAINKGFARCHGEIMAWLNSDDMLMPGSLHVIGEIFQTLPEVRWLTGLSAFWDVRDRLVHVNQSMKSRLDFAAGRPQWIQQESTFWRRDLWEETGGSLDASYRHMIDNELWSRFFMRAPLHHVKTVLSGYRYHGANRANLQSAECGLELRRITKALHEQLPEPDRRRADNLAAAWRRLERTKAWKNPLGRLCKSLLKTTMRRSLARDYPVIHYAIRDGRWITTSIRTYD